MMVKKATVKQILGEIPFTAELYWQFRQDGKPLRKNFSLHRLEKRLPGWISQATAARGAGLAAQEPRRMLIFSALRYWIEHATLLSLALAGQGHTVSHAYWPYANWRKPMNKFDLRRQGIYARGVFQRTTPLVDTISLLDVPSPPPTLDALPKELAQEIQSITIRDVRYTLQIENIDENDPLYHLRLERNTQAALAALTWMKDNHPDVVLTPNGSILEMGAVYKAARYLDIPVVTYEFGEQRGRIWLARDDEIMRQETGALWAVYKDSPLTEAQWERIRALYASRQGANLWENFSRRWQGLPAQGGAQTRQIINLDDRPIALLPTNVIGDSLTLGRQVFTQTMTEWLEGAIRYFARHPDTQLVIRIHPGERFANGPSVADIVQKALPNYGLDSSSAHIHLVTALDPVNTYDLIEIADLGLAYTTTVGLEMAMSGVPVVVAGHTHYRNKGFTLDPDTWDGFYYQLDQILTKPETYQLTRQQVEQAWNYAYRFFFDYPLPFPWHLMDFWEQTTAWPIERALSVEGQDEFGEAFRCLAGIPREWTRAGIPHQDRSTHVRS